MLKIEAKIKKESAGRQVRPMEAVKKAFINNSVSILWICSYIIIVVVCITGIGIVYNRSKVTIEKRLNSTSMQMVEDIQRSMITDMESLYEYAQQISVNVRVTKMLYANDFNSPSYKLNTYYLTRDLFAFDVASDKLAMLYIYNIRENKLITTNATFSKYYFFNKNYSGTSVDYTKWSNILSQYHYYEIVSFGMEQDNSGSIIALVHTLPTNGQKNVQANIVFQLNKEKIQAYLDNTIVDGQMNFILDSQDNVLFSRLEDKDFNVESLLSQLKDEHEPYLITAGNIKYVVVQSADNIMKWKFIHILPYNQYVKGITQDRNIAVAIALACVLVTLLLLLFILRFNIGHIRNIIGILNGKKVRQMQYRGTFNNEYDQIENKLSEIMCSSHALECKYSQGMDVLRIRYLAQLLSGMDVAGALDYMERNLDVSLKNCECAVLRCAGSADMPDALIIHDIDPLISGINLVLDRLPGGYWFYHTIIDGALVYVICAQSGKTARAAELDGLLRDAARNGFGDLSVTLTISPWYNNPVMLHLAFIQAKEACEHSRLMTGGASYIKYEDLCEMESEEDIEFDTRELKEIYHFASILDIDRTTAGLNAFKARVFSSRYLPPHVLRFYMNELTYTICSALYDHAALQGSSFLQNENPVKRLLEFTNFEGLRNGILQLLLRAREYSLRCGEDTSLEHSITRYIMDHYSDKDLTVTQIADYFNCSVSHISRLYKSRTGHGILDAINYNRVRAATSIMQSEAGTVKDIADRVGFSSIDSFIRVFKKYEGVTPGTYMKTRRSPMTI